MKNEGLKKFSTQPSTAGKVEMELDGDWFRVNLKTRAGRHAARMWAYTIVGEGQENDGIAKAVLDYVGREELQNEGVA